MSSEDDDNFEMHSPSKGEPGYRATLSAAGQEAVTALIEATPKLLLDRELKEALARLCDAYAACNGEDHPAYNAARKLLSRG